MSISVSEDSALVVRPDHSPFETWRSVLCVTCETRPLTPDDEYGQCKECAENELYSLFLV